MTERQPVNWTESATEARQSKAAADEEEETGGELKKEDRGQENHGQAKQAGEAAVNNRISVSDGHRRWTRRGAQKQKCARSFDNCQMQWATGCRGKEEEKGSEECSAQPKPQLD